MADRPRELTVPAGDHPVILAPSYVAERLGDLPEIGRGAIVRTYDGGDPPDLDGVEFWVAPFLGDGGVQVLAAADRLKVVQLLGAGAERFIEAIAEHAPDRGLVLCNARGAPSGASAEWCVAAMTASVRGFDRSLRAQDQGTWDYRVTGELLGKSVLILGAGDVAQAVVRRLDGWEVDVRLVGTTARDGVHGIEELPDLVPPSDVVLLLVPQTPATVGLVNAEFLAQMKDGALLVNAARGPVVDTDALLAELATGRITAVLDVTEPEPLPDGHPLFSAPGVTVHPHIAGSVPSTGRRGAQIAVEQVARFLRGEPLRNVVHDY